MRLCVCTRPECRKSASSFENHTGLRKRKRDSVAARFIERCMAEALQIVAWVALTAAFSFVVGMTSVLLEVWWCKRER